MLISVHTNNRLAYWEAVTSTTELFNGITMNALFHMGHVLFMSKIIKKLKIHRPMLFVFGDLLHGSNLSCKVPVKQVVRC